MDADYILEVDSLSKSFPGVHALDNVTLKVRKGTVHALMGENGAGKSTLMKILIGIYQPDNGSIVFKQRETKLANTHDALAKGISMIHQELSPVPHMTVAENIFLGREPTYGKTGIVRMEKMINDTKQLFDNLGIHIDPRLKMRQLSVANIQMVEIAKAISYNSDLIIMDEPTSAITEKEVEQLFNIITDLRTKGMSVIYITHKMDEVFKIADDITVFRDGKHIATESAGNLNKEKLIEMMVGRELTEIYLKDDVEKGEVVLSVRNLTKKGQFNDVSFDLHKGEILGLSGLMGAGRTEVVQSIFGVTKPDAGEIYVKGQRAHIDSPEEAIKHNMAFLTEDRKSTGLFLGLSVKDNIIMASVDKFKKKFALDKRAMSEVCEKEKNRLDIKTPSINQTIRLLSGGNQQKVLVSRWLLTTPDILILDEPTRGIDVGAKSEIYKLMSNLAQQGKAIIMVSSELPEILGMSDRIIVMHEGRITGEFNRGDATQEKILECATA